MKFPSIAMWFSIHILLTAKADDLTDGSNSNSGTSLDLEQMFQKMEDDTKLFAQKMELFLLPDNKCSNDVIASCSEANYNVCNSELPSATCPGYDYVIPACGSGQEGGCSGLYDFTAAIVSLVPNKDRRFHTDSILSLREKDAICSSLPADEYMIGASEDSKAYWSRFGVLPPPMYYGNDDGVFRMYPGTLEECPTGESDYDPTVRPWYVAASSGPKNIILVLDTSGSMQTADRIGIMKEAAKRVINTLGVSDYFAVVEFDTTAKYVSGSTLQRATAENKNTVLRKIDGLDPTGGTNFYNGFDMAFDIFRSSEIVDKTSGCHQAILFLTDGMMSDDKNALFSLLNEEVTNFINRGKFPPAMFTYSFGAGADSTVLKEIACDYNGIWSDVKEGGDLARSMGGYYKYFANAGLSEDNFVAWVEPYEYSTTGELGTTASAPVFDRSVDPPIFLGVVGLDFSFAAMERALGKEGQDSKNKIIDKIVKRSVAVCPKLEFRETCQLESLRAYGSNAAEANFEATCSTNCTLQPLSSLICSNTTYPVDIWHNELNKGRSFEEKVCCSVGAETRIANSLTYDEVKALTCSEPSRRSIVGILVGSIVGSIIVLIVSYCIFLKCKECRKKDAPIYSKTDLRKFRASESRTPIVILPPPSAPQDNHS